MRKALGLIAVASVALAVWLSPGQVLAEDAAVHNLVGTWTGPLKVLRAKGIGKGTLTIRVTDQDGALFKARMPGRRRAPSAKSAAGRSRRPPSRSLA